MHTLNLDLGERSYPIYIGSELLAQTELLQQYIAGRQVFIVSNETVAPLYLEKIQQSLGNRHTDTLILPDGEQYKNLATLEQIFDRLLQQRFDRHCTLLALGGGVIGDMTGFAAASYQRGVDFIQIPTTLLAQVDSSVGGKTAVNHPRGKNMIGAFHQPRLVLIDTDTLATLPDRELAAGFAEVIKYGLIRDSEFLTWLENNLQALQQREPQALAYAITRSCEIKAEIVAADERESGVRALLNLGHTFGHAIEAGLGYGRWLHGEAVAAGLVMAADLSARLGWLNNQDVSRISALLEQAGLPIQGPGELNTEHMLELMAVDKKVQDGQLRLVLLENLGKAKVTQFNQHDLLLETLEQYGIRPI